MNLLTRALGAFVGFLGGLTVYGAAGGTVGAVAGLIAFAFGKDYYVGFLLGLFLPLWPLHAVFSSAWMLNRRMAKYDAMRVAGVVTKKECDELRRAALDWYMRTALGRKPNETPPVPQAPPEPPRQAN